MENDVTRKIYSAYLVWSPLALYIIVIDVIAFRTWDCKGPANDMRLQRSCRRKQGLVFHLATLFRQTSRFIHTCRSCITSAKCIHGWCGIRLRDNYVESNCEQRHWFSSKPGFSFYALLNLKDESRSASASLIPVESIRQAIRNGAYAFSGSERNFTKPNFQRKWQIVFKEAKYDANQRWKWSCMVNPKMARLTGSKGRFNNDLKLVPYTVDFTPK